jgi:hypothetical protein
MSTPERDKWMNWGDFREKQTLSGVNMEGKQSTQYEQLCALKRTRGGYASHVTRKYRTVREMIDQRRDVTVIRDTFDEFKGAFDRFEKSHYECSQLAAVVEPEKHTNRDEHFEEMLRLMYDLQSEVADFESKHDPVNIVDDIKPSDSVSQHSSSSSTSSAIAKAVARKAALQTKSTFLEQQQDLARQKFELECREQKVVLTAEISAAEAEERSLLQFQNSARVAQPVGAAKSDTGVMQSKLNPLVPAFVRRDPMQSVHTARPAAAITVETESHVLHRQMLDAINLPKATIMTFDGEPIHYWLFINQFDSSVGDTSVSDAAKLNRLMQYCTGRAAKILQPCALMPPTEGYARARELLRERFGNDYTISEAWLRKITEGPLVIRPNDGVALQEYADDVNGCVETLRAMGRLGEVDNRSKMVRIVDRLPNYLVNRWRKQAVDTLNRHGEYPGITSLAEFLQRAARELNDPVFGSVRDQSKQEKIVAPRIKSNAYSSFSVQASDKSSMYTQASDKSSMYTQASDKSSITMCYLCNQGHRLVNCQRFMKMSSHEKLELVKQKRLCFNCLGSRSHMTSQCRHDIRCTDCGRKHSSLLHQAFNSAPNKVAARDGDSTIPKEVNSAPEGAASCVCGPKDSNVSKVALPIVVVDVKGTGQDKYVRTLALLDSGSNKTFCSDSLMQRLGLIGEKTTLALETLTEGKDTDTSVISLEVTGTSGKLSTRKVVKLPAVHAMTRFPVLKESMADSDDVKKWVHLRDINVPQMRQLIDSDVMLLIGQDVPQALLPLEVREGQEGEPYATRTVLGWTLNGPIGQSVDTTGTCNLIQAGVGPEVSLESQVERFWRLDTDQVLADSVAQMSPDDKRAVEIWNKSISLKQGHYEMDVPFKSTDDLPDDRSMAEKRLQSLGRKLSRDAELCGKYQHEIRDLIDKGYAERVPDDQIEASPGRTWYIPHHAVTNPNKPGKLRVVFDCAAEYVGSSLNKNVLSGPDLTNKLLGVLLRFREGRVAIMGDVETMFYQVRVTPDHRDVLRFLWWKNGEIGQEVEVYRMTTHLFGGVWSPSCANFALRRTAEEHCNEYDPDVVSAVLENFYVDDCLESVMSDEKAMTMVSQLCELLSKGGFHLTKWTSNSRKVLGSIPEEDRAKGVKGLDLDQAELPVERALGVHWDTETDEFGLSIKLKERAHTKRGLLAIVSSVYDPLGFVCPYVLQAKMIFQAECRLNKGWDEKLEENNCRRWIKWLGELPLMVEFKVERCLEPVEFTGSLRYELHLFSDASQDGYGAVAYIRIVDSAGRINCRLVLGKSRLAPMKHMTIPRLELSAAVVAVRMDSMLRRELRLDLGESTFWTDSTIVLQYIKNTTRRFQTFVANRVGVIHDGSSPSQWRYVETNDNPADDASRGLNASRMVGSSRWKLGPDFLWKEEDHWPAWPSCATDLPQDDKEVKKNVTACAVEAVTVSDSFDRLLERYSSWYRLTRAVAWLLRFRTWLRARGSTLKGSLQVSELQEAEEVVLRSVQRRHFHEELQSLQNERTVSRKSSIYPLEPFRDEHGLLRVGGRLQAAPISDLSKHQVIVPRDSHVAELIVRHVHESESKHSGREYVMSLVRCRYWIPRARPLVNRILRNCVLCKKLKGVPEVQRMANLPSDRVTPDSPPFTYVGLDCFGPFLVKRGRSHEKRYGCLFTCLTVRAIHLEKLNTMDSDSFINALLRFCARRGVPDKIRSDNGTNFVGAERELNESFRSLIESNKVKGHCLEKRINWEFNPPAASHMGGVWERQIRTVRKVLNVIVRDQVLDDERLDTFLCQVESCVNGRPLTPLSDSITDLESLTPNHLLLLRSGSLPQLGRFVAEDVYTRRWRHVQLLSDQFWKRWVREYLPTIQLRHKWIQPSRNLRVGDLVLVIGEVTPRNEWPLGRILETFPGSDGLVRVVRVKTSKNILTRPVAKLCLLVSEDGNDQG